MKFGKLEVLALLGTVLTISAVSCKKDDPDYSKVTPPEVAVTYSISGRVTSMSGDGISATVSINGEKSVTTGTDGKFVFEDVAEGTYTLKAEAKDKVSKEASVTVNKESGNPVWNVSLSNAGTAIVIKSDGSASGDAKSETLKGNDAAEIEMTVTAPAEVVKEVAKEGAQIIVTPTYSADDAEKSGTKASDEKTFLIGTNLSCTDPDAKLSADKTISIDYDIDAEVAKTIVAQKYSGGKWVDVKYSVNNGKVTVVADEFTSYSLFCTAKLSTSVSAEVISFSPDSWDNLYGSKGIEIGSASYTYKIGTDIQIKNTDKVTAYLTEIVARAAGAGVTTAQGSYPINVTLPVGTAMKISGKQVVTTYTATALDRSASGKQYGTVTVVTSSWNRQHTGGGSNN